MTDSAPGADLTALRGYLEGELDETVTGVEVLQNGLNLVVAVSTTGAAPAYVVRRPNKLRGTYYMHSLDEEFELLRRLEPTPVAAPAPVLHPDDETVLGGPFVVVTYLDGEVVPLGDGLPSRFRSPDARGRLATSLVDALAEIHTLDTGRFEGVCARVTPRERVVRATERFDSLRSVTGHDSVALEAVAEWLRRNAPTPDETVLVHGDFRPGNLLFGPGEEPTVTGVLDWETARLGDPLTDLGYLLLRWRDEGDPTPSLDRLDDGSLDESTREELRAANERGLAPFTAQPGSPDRRALMDRYEAETGIDVENERFYRAQAAFLLALVWADLHRCRVEAGEASGREPWVDYALLLAEAIIDDG
ncbi:phosphotransferase family protein [Natronomonas marina]|uniref:phosphotransferase family protein n=1 Tax=Natronomonas marina TaxID=2961939 RepID=UPI0020C9CE28|nr:phosphotransferase family protein [Natronomonas marina]